MNAKWIAVAAALAAPVAATAAGSAQTLLPVNLTASTVLPAEGGIGQGGNGLVAVSFQNTADQAATDVVLDVVDNRGILVSRIDDRGSFAPGVAVNHRFYVPNVTQANVVSIAEVRLADGTIVTNGTQPARVLRQESAPATSTYDADLFF